MSSKPQEKGLSYAFKQQIMKAWQPVPTLTSTIVLFSILSLFFLIMGIVLISYTEDVAEHYQRYDVLCKGMSTCTVNIALDQKFKKPVYLYYELSNYYQNHRRYVKSKSSTQLSGEYQSTSELTDCEPVVTNAQMGKEVGILIKMILICKISVSGTKLKPDDPAIPCGLIAKSIFNDTFSLQKQDVAKPIKIIETDIAWPSDKEGRYKNIGEDWKEKQWLNMTNEHFMVWMRTAALPTFRKLWGRIENDLEEGRYVYTIQNNYNVSKFEGQKALVLSTTNVFGGKNEFLAISYIVVGVVCSLITIGFLIRKLLANQENKNK